MAGGDDDEDDDDDEAEEEDDEVENDVAFDQRGLAEIAVLWGADE